jgi:DNA polymerase-3 subunit gamma/tau
LEFPDQMSEEPGKASEYRVLARKYRPSTFDDLIGQEPMVRTLRNAFQTGRIAQAYMLTGVRGVGKTTTARILARALNYETDTVTEPTLDLAEPGIHCQAIMEGSHVDVVEMDAASNRGIDDAREINASLRYKPVSARFKVYILDEVHMLTKEAFNALLKTLEEPPPHVKFIFATTEINKVPVTILSRCQRFDLRRIETSELAEHLKGIAASEKIEAEDDALAMIARAGEGSVRDALSLFDQAIAHATGPVVADGVRSMLGLADRARTIDLFEHVMKGDIAAALSELKEQYDTGAEPATVLRDLAAFTHFVTRLRFVKGAVDDPSLTPDEKTRGPEFAEQLSPRILGRAWQMLLKGIGEVEAASQPLAAADMVLVRLTHAADLPTPDDVLRQIKDGTLPPSGGGGGSVQSSGGGATAVGTSMPSGSGGSGSAMRMAAGGNAPMLVIDNAHAEPAEPDIEPAPTPDDIGLEGLPPPAVLAPVHDSVASFEDMLRLAEDKRDIQFKLALRNHVSPIRFEPATDEAEGVFIFSPVGGSMPSLRNDIAERLRRWTGKRHRVVEEEGGGSGSLKDLEEAERSESIRQAEADPVVAAVLSTFPKSTILEVRNHADDDTESGLDSADAAEAALENPDFEDDS